MRAAVIHELAAEPVVEDFPDPPAGSEVARVLAAALNPVDVTIAAGRMPLRHLDPPFVAGVEGIGLLSDGSRRYFSAPTAPYGSLAEWVPLAGAETAAVPLNLDPAVAAALGVSGLAGWLSMQHAGRLAAGETVLVMGANGMVGQIAVQAARLVGAGRVIGAARSGEGCQIALDRGADAAVTLDDLDSLTQRLREVAPDGYDLVLDMVWGPAIMHAIEAARRGARVVQVGNAAGPAASIVAPAFRNKQISIIGYSNFLLSTEVRVAGYERLAAHAAAGELTVQVERYSLDELPVAWRRLTAGSSSRKLVVVPGQKPADTR
jgi:NADPH2:quinone reductase